MCRGASGDVSRRLTLRGVLVTSGDATAVALRRVGIAAWRDGKSAVTWQMWGIGEEWWARMAWRGRRGRKRAGRGGARPRAERERVFGFARERESTNVGRDSGVWDRGRCACLCKICMRASARVYT